jgi:hypothetical protein
MIAVVALLSFFSGYDVIPLTLSAPFGDLFAHARRQAGYSVTGSMTMVERGRPVTIDGVTFTARGHTSLRETECTFPKLKVEFPRESGLHSVKIGTHCGEAAGTTVTPKYGRLANELSPHREAAIYRLLETLGVPTLKARPARITYIDTGAPGSDGARMVRNAMLLEGNESAAKRLGGSKDIEESEFTNARDRFTPEDTATIAFAEAMIGNFDWCLRMTPTDRYRCDAQHPLWNIGAAAGAGEHAIPFMYDFDVSGMVAGHHLWFKNVFSTAFSSSASEPWIEVFAQLQRTRTLFTRATLDTTRRRFMRQKANAYRVIDAAPIDVAGRALMVQYLDSFFAIIAADADFYQPVVVAPKTRAYTDANGAAGACGDASVLPVGTAVSTPLQKNDRYVQVRVLDVLWRWAPPVKCPAIHENAVWIDAAAISADFPARDAAQHRYGDGAVAGRAFPW